MPKGPALLDGAALVTRSKPGGSVYLLDIDAQGHIVRPIPLDVFNRFGFQFDKVLFLPDPIINNIRQGPFVN